MCLLCAGVKVTSILDRLISAFEYFNIRITGSITMKKRAVFEVEIYCSHTKTTKMQILADLK